MVKLQLPCDLIVTHGEASASVSLVSGFCPAMASDSKSHCGPQCAQCQWWGAIAFDEAVPPVHLAVAGRIATSDLPVAASKAPSADQPAAAELVIPDYPRSLRHLDRDFRVAKRDSPHVMTDERCRRMMAAAPGLCRNDRPSVLSTKPIYSTGIICGPLSANWPRSTASTRFTSA